MPSPATPCLSAWASVADSPSAPLSTISWSMAPKGFADLGALGVGRGAQR